MHIAGKESKLSDAKSEYRLPITAHRLRVVYLNAFVGDALCQPFHVFVDLLDDVGFVDRKELAIFHEDTAVYNYRLHISGARIVDQTGCHAVQRLMVGAAHI
jgi:hypothetical protein